MPATQAGRKWSPLTAGTLAKPFVLTYFTTPRPTYELYDLDNDPGELENLAGRPDLAKVEHQLKEALTEKMILDWDFLPLPLRRPDEGKQRSTGGLAHSPLPWRDRRSPFRWCSHKLLLLL